MSFLRFLGVRFANFFRRLLFLWWAIITCNDLEEQLALLAMVFCRRDVLRERVKEERDYRYWKRRLKKA